MIRLTRLPNTTYSLIVFRKDWILNLVTTLVPEGDVAVNKDFEMTGNTCDGVSFSVTLQV